MQQKRVYWILALGAAVVAGAWVVRKQIQDRRRLPVASAQSPDRQAVQQELARLRKAVAAAPTDTAARWALIEFYNRYGLLDPAGAQIVAVLKLDPKDKRAHLELANALLAKKRFALSEASYRDVIDMDPKSLEAWQGLSATLIKERRYLEANGAAQYALKLSPKDPNSHLMLATSALEYAEQFPDPAAHAGELEFARKELEFLKTVLLDNADIYFALGRCYRGLHNAPAAISNLELAHRILPDRQDIGLLLAVAYRANNERPKAIKLLEELTAKPHATAPNFDLLGQLYQVGSQADTPQKALQAFKKAVELMPKAAGFQQNLGSAYYRVGDMQAARSTFENVTRLDPQRSYAFQQLALVYTRVGQPQLASAAAQIARELTFNEEQLTQIQEVAKKHPESVNLHLLLAKRYSDLKMAGPSRDEYITILKLDPKNSQVPEEIRRAAKAGYIPLK